MIHAERVNEIIKSIDSDYFEIVRKYDTIDALWGLEHRILTDNDIKALKEGNFLYCNNGEYAQIISYEPQESEDEDVCEKCLYVEETDGSHCYECVKGEVKWRVRDDRTSEGFNEKG